MTPRPRFYLDSVKSYDVNVFVMCDDIHDGVI